MIEEMQAGPLVEMIVLFFSMIIQVILPPLPAEVIVIAAGKRLGLPITTIIAGTGLLLGSIIVYFGGGYLRGKLNRFFKRERVRDTIHRIKKYETWILWVRIMPYNPSDTISYAAGILKVEKRKFITISVFTSYARCFVLALLGSLITSYKNVIQILVLLLISAVLAHLVLRRKM